MSYIQTSGVSYPAMLTPANLVTAGLSGATAVWQLQDLTDEGGTYNLTQLAGSSFAQAFPDVPGQLWRLGTTSELQNTNAIFRANAALTAGIIVRHEGYAAGTDDYIFGCRSAAGPSGVNADGWGIGLEVTTNVWFYEHGNASTNTKQTFQTPVPYEKYFIIFTRNAAGTEVKIYINGALTNTFSGLIVPLAGSSSTLRIMGDGVGSMNGYVSNAFVQLGEEADAATVQNISRIVFPYM